MMKKKDSNTTEVKRYLLKLQDKISTPVEIGMRYQEPSIEHGLRSLVNKGCNLSLIHI